MQEKQIACVVLVLAMAAFVYGTLTAHGKMVKEQKAALEARQAAIKAEGIASKAKRELTQLEDSTAQLRNFAKAWSPYVEAVSSSQATEQKVIDLIKDAGVFALSQRFELLDQKKDAFVKKRLRANITIEDHYAKVLNWMGAVESAIPVCRVSSCRLTRGQSGNDIRLELILDFPVISEKMAG
jgi:hypothetical protein